MYHRVAELPADPHLLAVTPDHFVAHLEIIQRYASAVPLSSLVEALHHGDVPNRAIALTFDDGYADNLQIAKPLLERYEVPATIFVATGQIDSPREFWWDELDRLLLQPGTVPARFRSTVSGAEDWEMGEAATYTEADYQRHRDWHVERHDDPTARQRLFRSMFERLREVPDEDRRAALNELAAWSGSGVAARPSHRVLTADELRRLAGGGLIDVGAHTVTHPLLAPLPVREQAREIRGSQTRLQAILGRPVTSFAYPSGSFTAETVACLRDSGFGSACTSEAEPVWQGTDPYRLPRLGVRDWDAETFARWLRWWLDG